ncbi:ASCH domain-containing protein [Vibrio navarrensis]|nr:ASCH domain-containing protein [Vibrio navarrensis]
MNTPNKITFFERFESDILSGKKTITIRDEAESHYVPGSQVDVATFEDDRLFCRIEILSVEPISLSELNDHHASQENMTLPVLKEVIAEIYPGLESLYVIAYKLA